MAPGNHFFEYGGSLPGGIGAAMFGSVEWSGVDDLHRNESS